MPVRPVSRRVCCRTKKVFLASSTHITELSSGLDGRTNMLIERSGKLRRTEIKVGSRRPICGPLCPCDLCFRELLPHTRGTVPLASSAAQGTFSFDLEIMRFARTKTRVPLSFTEPCLVESRLYVPLAARFSKGTQDLKT